MSWTEALPSLNRFTHLLTVEYNRTSSLHSVANSSCRYLGGISRMVRNLMYVRGSSYEKFGQEAMKIVKDKM